MAKQKILITGITGFIGSHLAKKLKENGYQVSGITKVSSSRNNLELEPFLSGIKITTCDVSDYYSTHNIIHDADPDVIVHLAASSSIKDSFEKPFLDVNTNILGTMNIAHSIMELPNFKEKRLLYASAAAIYGNQDELPIKETATPRPLNPYSINKAMSETYLNTLSRIYGLKVVSMRPTNTYGRKLDPSFYIEYLITNMLKGNKIYLGSPDTIRDYMYVDDHVNAYIKAIEHSEVNNEAFNVGLGIGTTNKEVAYKIADLLDFDKSNIVLGQYPPNYPFRPYDADQPAMKLDNSKIKAMLGWSSKTDLYTGLKKTVDFWKNKLNK